LRFATRRDNPGPLRELAVHADLALALLLILLCAGLLFYLFNALSANA
jgi:hypothetical protein